MWGGSTQDYVGRIDRYSPSLMSFRARPVTIGADLQIGWLSKDHVFTISRIAETSSPKPGRLEIRKFHSLCKSQLVFSVS